MAWSYPASIYTGSFQASSTACLGADGYGPVTKNTASAFGLNFRYRGISSRSTTLSDAQHDWVAGMCAALLIIYPSLSMWAERAGCGQRG